MASEINAEDTPILNRYVQYTIKVGEISPQVTFTSVERDALAREMSSLADAGYRFNVQVLAREPNGDHRLAIMFHKTHKPSTGGAIASEPYTNTSEGRAERNRKIFDKPLNHYDTPALHHYVTTKADREDSFYMAFNTRDQSQLHREMASLETAGYRFDVDVLEERGNGVQLLSIVVHEPVERPLEEVEAIATAPVGWSNTQHRKEAEKLIQSTYAITRELREVPAQGVDKPIDGLEHIKGRSIHYTQEQRRDALGRQLQGIYALAQVHATLAQGKY
jgi:hypothetical protein